jgi:hypothetical protein
MPLPIVRQSPSGIILDDVVSMISYSSASGGGGVISSGAPAQLVQLPSIITQPGILRVVGSAKIVATPDAGFVTLTVVETGRTYAFTVPASATLYVPISAQYQVAAPQATFTIFGDSTEPGFVFGYDFDLTITTA